MSEQNEKNGKILEIIKIINKNVYLILALMIFLGFFQIFIYYQNFDIGVYNYSSPFELLFYFIPSNIITPIKVIMMILNNRYSLIFIFLIIIIYIFGLLIGESYANCIFIKLKDLWNKPYQVINNEKRYKFIKTAYYLITTLYITFISYFIIRLIYRLLALDELSGIDYYLTKNFINAKGSNNFCFQILFLLWGLFIFVRLFRYLHNKKRLQTIMHCFTFTIIFIIMLLFTFESLKTTQKVDSLKKKIPIQEVRFLYNSDTIETNDSNIYIGSTKDYLFIRNIDKKENKLYSVNNIKFLESILKRDTISIDNGLNIWLYQLEKRHGEFIKGLF